MVIITIVYVFATIAICLANFKSAKASREQLKESKRQFNENQRQAEAELEESKRQFNESQRQAKAELEESKHQFERQFEEINRPHITCEYILASRAFCCIRISNYGNKPARKVTFKINDEFLNIIPDDYKEFAKLNEAEYYIGVNQHYDFFFSDINKFKNNKTAFVINLQYETENKKYSDTITIDFTKQLPVFTVDDSSEKIQKELKEISRSIKELSNKIKCEKNL